MSKDIVFRFKEIHHGRNNCLTVWCFFRSTGEFIMPNLCHDRIKAGELQGGIVCAIADVVAVREASILSNQVHEEVFVIPLNQDHLFFLHEIENKVLKLFRFAPAVEKVSEDNQLVWLRIGKESGLFQSRFQDAEESMNICNDVG